jgi:hypothetical protein
MDTRHPDSVQTSVYLVMYRRNDGEGSAHAQCAFETRADAEDWARELDMIHDGEFSHWVTKLDYHDTKAWNICTPSTRWRISHGLD